MWMQLSAGIGWSTELWSGLLSKQLLRRLGLVCSRFLSQRNSDAMNNRMIVIGLLITLILVGGCSSRTMDNVDIHPPTQGLLHYLKKDQMANVRTAVIRCF